MKFAGLYEQKIKKEVHLYTRRGRELNRERKKCKGKELNRSEKKEGRD